MTIYTNLNCNNTTTTLKISFDLINGTYNRLQYQFECYDSNNNYLNPIKQKKKGRKQDITTYTIITSKPVKYIKIYVYYDKELLILHTINNDNNDNNKDNIQSELKSKKSNLIFYSIIFIISSILLFIIPIIGLIVFIFNSVLLYISLVDYIDVKKNMKKTTNYKNKIIEKYGIFSKEYGKYFKNKYGEKSGDYGNWLKITYGENSQEYKNWIKKYKNKIQ